VEAAARTSSGDVFSSPRQGEDSSRKRAFSNISGDNFTPPVASRHAGWAAENRPIQPYPTPTLQASYSANSLAPKPLAPTADVPALGQLAAIEGIDQDEIDQMPDIEDELFQR